MNLKSWVKLGETFDIWYNVQAPTLKLSLRKPIGMVLK